MKNISVEEKAKVHDKFVKELKSKFKDFQVIIFNKNDLEKFFPELKESEDEKIRTALIYHYQGDGCLCTNKYRIDYKEIRAWLEKQGKIVDYYEDRLDECACKYFNKGYKQALEKQTSNADNANKEYWRGYREGKQEILDKYAELEKQSKQNPILDFKAADWYVSKVDGKIHNIHQSVDKVEPKFKVGDWVMLDRPVLITKVVDMPYNTHQYWTSDGTWFGDATKAKLWTIQDAKDGDVLAFDNDIIVIFKDLYNAYTFHSYCYIQDRVFYTNEGSVPAWWKAEHFYPATKEQRDQLEKAMINAGYEWNAEKKELEHKNE